MKRELTITPTKIGGVLLYGATVRADDRGEFVRHFNSVEIEEFGGKHTVAQANLVKTSRRGTFRGMHFQVDRFAETKLLSCVVGNVVCAVTDLRPFSPTFRQSQCVELSGDKYSFLLIPKGVASGYLTMSDSVIVHYYSTAPYSAAGERGFRYDDPSTDIALPFVPSLLSPKDQLWPPLSEYLHQISTL